MAINSRNVSWSGDKVAAIEQGNPRAAACAASRGLRQVRMTLSAAECAAAWDLLNIRCGAIIASTQSGKQLCVRIAMMLSKMG